jgi:hypothetical protein
VLTVTLLQNVIQINMSSQYPLPRNPTSQISQETSSSLWVRNKQRNSLFVGAQPGQGFGTATTTAGGRKKKKKRSTKKSSDNSFTKKLQGFWSKDKHGAAAHNNLNDVDSRGLPLVIKAASRYVERCLSTEGLYRVSGNKSRVQSFYDMFQSGKGNTVPFAHSDVHVWTGLMKQFLRDQPEPLLTFELFDSFIDIASVQDDAMRQHYLQIILSNLPPENGPCVAHLMLHLHAVAEHCEDNLMNFVNLGVVFGPTILRPQEETMEYLKKVPLGNKVVELMIEFAPKLFVDYAERAAHRKEERRRRHHPPHIITSVIEYLEASDLLGTDGLYRVSGSKTTINELKQMCIRGEKGLSGRFVAMGQPHVATGLLKQYLRELPEPLVPFNVYDEFVRAAKTVSVALTEKEEKNEDSDTFRASVAESLHDAIASLPDLNRRTLRLVIRHLSRVSMQRAENRMNSENLSVVFGPTCLRPLHETPEQMLSGDDKMVIKALIDLCEHVFLAKEDSDNEDTGLESAKPALLTREGLRVKTFVVPYNAGRFQTDKRRVTLYSSDDDDDDGSHGDSGTNDKAEQPDLPLPLPPRLAQHSNSTSPRAPPPSFSAFSASLPHLENKINKKADEEINTWKEKCHKLEDLVATMTQQYLLLEKENKKLREENDKYKTTENYRKQLVKGTILPPGMSYRSKLGIIDGVIEGDEEDEDEDEDEDEGEEENAAEDRSAVVQIHRMSTKEENSAGIDALLEEKSSFGDLLGGVLGGVLGSPEKAEVIDGEKNNNNEKTMATATAVNGASSKETEENITKFRYSRSPSSPPVPASMKQALNVMPLLGQGRTNRAQSEHEGDGAFDARTSTLSTVAADYNITSTPRHRPAPPVPPKKHTERNQMIPPPHLTNNTDSTTSRKNRTGPPPAVPRKPANIHSHLRQVSDSGGASEQRPPPPPPGIHHRSRTQSLSKKPTRRATPPNLSRKE